ncbi:sarcosine oxidase [Aureimonas endophytica]|uniref:Sarcosine oxidase n=2 Tax=Aureimonas endophytica TaxID=2027858 RepID=A0A917E6X7_9HYPH|nr:FAD-dependent oxidoreductase [Aureimonas endophytica]GGE10327.1 sarcosine oxidase [Aureimonas endophytica]
MSRITIVGGGIVGLSVARAMLKRGHEVHVLDQGPIPNPRGASVDRHRMIRPHYGDATGYARMVAPAFAAWDRLWDDLGAAHFENTGAVAISLEPGDYADRTLASFRAAGLPHEVVEGAALARLMPHLDLPDGAFGVLAEPAGPLFADRIVAELADWLRVKGARLEENCRVARVDPARGLAWRADGSEIAADHLLVAAGAWLPGLMPEAYGEAPAYRQALLYLDPPAAYAEAWRAAPPIVTLGDHTGYSLPDRRGAGLKIGYSAHRRRARPDVEGFEADFAAESRAILAPFAPYFRQAEAYRPLRLQLGYYVLAPERRFRLEAAGQGLVVTDCDGQMFKFGPLLGERIAGLFAGEENAADVTRWAAGY